MQVTVADFDILGKVPEEQAADFACPQDCQLQFSAPINNLSAMVFNRGGYRHTMTFTVTRQHPSFEDAVFFVASHQFKVSNVGGGVLTYKTDKGTLYSPEANVLASLQRLEGCSTTFAYRIDLGAWVDKKPTGAGEPKPIGIGWNHPPGVAV